MTTRLTPHLVEQLRRHFPSYGTNAGHGHAWPRPDGVRARCGGPRVCGQCARDRANVDTAQEKVAAEAAAAARAVPNETDSGRTEG